jgi:3-hydroxyisobutyrate dehydrogenase
VPYLQMKGKAIAERNFEPSFALKLAAKDARLAVEAAQRRELDLPVLEAISERMQQGVPEHGDQDVIATYLTSAPPASAAWADDAGGAAQ